MQRIRSTRPALSHFAGRAGDHNDRAMAGSPYLAAELARRLGLAPTVIGRPEPAMCVDWQRELEAARPALADLKARYERMLADGFAPFTALSRCAAALATVPVVARRHPDAVVVWLDAHADINTPESTTTGYLGGLALSGPLGLWESGLGQGLASANAILVGTRDIDPYEKERIAEGVVTLVAPGPGLAARLAEALAGRAAYVHIDCDVLEPGIVPTDYRVPGGLDLAQLREIAAVISANGIVGLEIAEFEADETGAGTQAAARRLVEALEPLFQGVGEPAMGA